MLWKQLSEPFHYEKILQSSDFEKKITKKKARANDTKTTLGIIWRMLTLQKGLFFFVLFLVVISSALALAGPVLIGRVIDDYIVARKLNGLSTILFMLIAVYIVYSLSSWLQNIIMIGIAQRTVLSLRTKLFSHLHKLPIAFFDKRQQGELMSRVTNDIENVSSTLNSSVIQVFSSTLTLIGTLSVMLYLSPLLALITMIIIPVMFLGMRWITSRTGKLFQKQQQSLGELNGVIEESISGQTIIKAFSAESKVNEQFLDKVEKLKLTGFWSQTYSGMIPKLMNVLNNASFAIIAGVGGIFALKGWITIGVIVIFVEFARQFTRPLNDLANQFNTLLSAIAGAERVFEILNTEEEGIDERNKDVLRDVKGEVSFQNVSFSYEEEGSTLRHITFTAKPGDTVALVGPTGAGKTTIINLLSRFYNYNEGVITIDGVDVTSVTRASVRKQMAFVLQESFLFQGTIEENIRYGRLEASEDEIIEAAKLANAHSFIERLPNGYQTMLNNGGSGLSQGQRQLLAIARAILANPIILILDEATSSIDTITELHIQQALKRLMKGRTSFVIAHRLNTIREADQIIVLQNGSIIERGLHRELVQQAGFYHDLVEASLQN
ncbi:ABC transporter ATP-binding protein [Bacillus massiliigorillae]|uniref:ABC transporter ATP-binding protein n=1 Tax=Bacillus massiliigorillae TaxID=1243664 RepID=UPI0003A4CC53|nr:ABC transporter ATP-binding protein [Bacillus massiliigorillae]